MPYIDTMARERIDSGGKPENVGELTYVIYKALLDYANYALGGNPETISYARLAQCTAAVDNASREFYRRAVVPYEDEKIRENGDV